MGLLAGIDVGGTNLRIGVVDGLSLIYEKRTHADFANLCKTILAGEAWQKIIQITSSALSEAIDAYPNITAVGIGFPGFINPATGRVTQSPNLPGLLDVDLTKDLSRAINRPVIVENDASAAAYGEYRLHHDGKGNPLSDNLVYIGLGTGVGGGLVYASKPFSGQHGFSMEVGHLIVEHAGRLCGCGNHGCLEQYASATGLSKSYQLATGQLLDSAEIAVLADAGDAAAIDAYGLAGSCLAQAVAHIVKVVDVGQVVVGGGVSQAWHLMQKAFDQRLQADLIPVLRDKVTVTISSSGDQAGIIGAALLAGARSGS
ncbi:MAG TPA: ROK family protein [Methylophilaceae bacterium]|jgi:glucokinase